MILNTVTECAHEAVKIYNSTHRESLAYKFSQFPVFFLLDVIDDIPVLCNVEKRGNWGN